MSKCFNCNIIINSSVKKCPLCHNNINISNTTNVYPIIENNFKYHTLLYQILAFLSLLGTFISVFINVLISHKISWSLFVVCGIISFWITFITAINHHNKMYKSLFFEILIIIIGATLWDYLTGWHEWSITYVLPFLCVSYIILFIVNRVFINGNRISKDYILYTYINSLIGLIPIYFTLRHKIEIVWPSIISIIMSISALIFLMVFNHKTITNELERRFHF